MMVAVGAIDSYHFFDNKKKLFIQNNFRKFSV